MSKLCVLRYLHSYLKIGMSKAPPNTPVIGPASNTTNIVRLDIAISNLCNFAYQATPQMIQQNKNRKKRHREPHTEKKT